MRCFLIWVAFLAGCTAMEGGGNYTSSRLSSACTAGLEQVFSEQYHSFLQNNCASCHRAGGMGNGGFADPDLTLAFNQFQLRGSTTVVGRAVDPNHAPPITGAQLQTEIDNIEPLWQAALIESATCNRDGGNDQPDIPSSANFITSAKLLNATEELRQLSWDLSSEVIAPVGTSFAGAVFSINVQTSVTATGETSYEFLNPQLTAGRQSLYVALIEIEINGNFVGTATTYRGIDRYVAGGDTQLLSQTAMIVPSPISTTDTLALTFGILEATDFTPTTYAALTGAGGIFAANCVGCHNSANAQGSLDLTNYNNLVTQFMVTPFFPDASEIYKRMIDVVDPMPPAGLLPMAEQNLIRDWVRDGAPEN